MEEQERVLMFSCFTSNKIRAWVEQVLSRQILTNQKGTPIQKKIYNSQEGDLFATTGVFTHKRNIHAQEGIYLEEG